MQSGVTIGIPVFNGARTLRHAVASALAQTCPADVIHISDNASTDATPEIARALAVQDRRVRYTRHAASLGLSGNFGFVLRQAATNYFMWLAADDRIEPTYVERMREALDADPGLVACVSLARFVRPDGSERMVDGTYPLLSDAAANLATYLSAPCDNTRIFGLYRTAALRDAFPPRHFHAYDLAVAAGTLLHGWHRELPEILMVRDETPSVAYVKNVRQENRSRFGVRRLFPLLPLTAFLVRRLRIPLRRPVLKALLKINLEAHLNYAGYNYPRYGATVGSLLRRHVLWRLELPRPRSGDPRPS